MKFKTFESLLHSCVDLYNRGVEQDKKLSEAFGDFSEVSQDWWGYSIDNIIDSIELEFNDKEERVQWLFWESILNREEYLDFKIDGIVYEGSPENIWMELNGILDEKFSKSVPVEIAESTGSVGSVGSVGSTELTKEKMINTHDEKDIKETDVTNPVPGDNPRLGKLEMEQEIDNLKNSDVPKDTVSDTKISKDDFIVKNIEEDHTPGVFDKIMLLRDRQIRLESIKYSDILENEINNLGLLDNDITLNIFTIELDKIFNSLLLDVKNKDNLNDMNNKIRMVLLQFTSEPINKEIASMIKFEVEKVFYNFTNLKSIFRYNLSEAQIVDNEIIIKGTWLWEDTNEREKSFTITVGEEIKIDFR